MLQDLSTASRTCKGKTKGKSQIMPPGPVPPGQVFGSNVSLMEGLGMCMYTYVSAYYAGTRDLSDQGLGLYAGKPADRELTGICLMQRPL